MIKLTIMNSSQRKKARKIKDKYLKVEPKACYMKI